MSSSGFTQKEINANIGRHNLHAEFDHSKTGVTGVTGPTLLANQTGLASSVQTTALISNDPKTIISQDQRIAANTAIITEKHVTQEFVPVIHEEIVTTIPVVTGQAVHTGQAIAGQTFVQQLGSQYIQQQAATKVDLIPEVQTQLGAQTVVNIPTISQPQWIGKANVITTEQVSVTQPILATQTQTVTQEIINQPGTFQQTGVFQQQPGTFLQQPGTFQQQPLLSQPLNTLGVPLTQSIPMNATNVPLTGPTFSSTKVEKKF